MTARPLMAALVGLALLLCIGAGLVAAYQRDMRHAYQRIGARGEVIASPLGDIEFVEGGQDGAIRAREGARCSPWNPRRCARRAARPAL